MRKANPSKHLYGLFICICVICLLPVFPLPANGATVTGLAGNALAKVSFTTPPLGWTATRSLITARYYHTATPLANGLVLVAGGYNGGVLSSCEIYNPSTGAWTATGSLNTERQYHTATLLANGLVLVAGGYNGGVLSSCEIYNPSTGAWKATGSLITARYYHTATLLANGLVLVAGGQASYGDALFDCEIYNPSTGAWTETGSLITARYYHTATLLANGLVLLAGGYNGGVLFDCEIYNPSTGACAETGSLITARYYHTATLLANGQVLVAGGYNGGVLFDCEIFNPSTGAWTETGGLITAREYQTATLLPSGQALVAGGYNGYVLSSCEIFDMSTGAWTGTGGLITAREYQTATLLPSGQVLVAGGYNGHVLASCEIFDSSDTAPGAPTGVSAKAGNAQATVSFTPPAINGGNAITGYTVTSNPGGITATGLGSPIIVSGLTNGVSYTFTVTATNAIGIGPASTPSNKVTPATVPDAPTGVTATAGNAQATVSFTAPASNGGYAITGYTVKSNSGGIKAEGHASPITVKGLRNGTDYTFTVTATNKIGTGPASSPSNSVMPLGAPGAPTGVSATAGNAEATVSFRLPANGGSTITGYTVTSNPGGITATGLGSPIIVSGLTNGTAYTFTVKATNAIGTGPASSHSNSVTPATIPDAPAIGMAISGDAEATVSFTAPASNGGDPITSYIVTPYVGASAGKTTSGPRSPITVKGLTNGVSYSFTVTATNKIGTGPASMLSNEVTPVTVPGAPTGVTATAGAAEATVSFTVPASNGGSPITSYAVISSPGGKTASGADSTITVTGLTNGTAYTFTVRATNALGNGPWSNHSKSVTPATTPGAPLNVKAKAGNAEATVSFKAPASNGSAITGYTVASNPSGGVDANAGKTSTTHTVKGLTNGTAYTFTVTATNKIGTGPASTASSPVTPQ